jgi:hypothetical protein
MKIQLLTHQDFKVLATFNEEPHYDEVFKVIEEKYGKEVVDYNQLDRENL